MPKPPHMIADDDPALAGPWPLDERWLLDLRSRADAPPKVPRAPLGLQGSAAQIGSIEQGWAERLMAAGLPLQRSAHGWVVSSRSGAALDAALDALARALRDMGPAAKWRDEQVSVIDAGGHTVSRIERAATRALGIATHAVHLVGSTADGSVWVQQRAFDKATDPGLWDTTVGGLVSADETPRVALEREAWEEAGLHVGSVARLASIGRISVRRPVTEGYMVEHIDMFEAVLPEHLSPVNQDGEVAAFERLQPAALWQRMCDGIFTLEATLILQHWLRRHGHLVQGREAAADTGSTAGP